MIHVADVAGYLDEFSKLELAEDWDNVGLLIGDPKAEVQRVMTCLTVTPETVAESVERRCDLVVTHHPLPFHPLKRITTDEPTGQMLWTLIGAGISVYSPHTGFDSTASGINAQLATRLGLLDVRPIQPDVAVDPDGQLGTGRIGQLGAPVPAKQWLAKIKREFGLNVITWSGDSSWVVQNVAVACGSGGSLLDAAIAENCDAFVTGEANFHTCLAARAAHVVLVMLGHYTSERFAVEWLSDHLRERFDSLIIWASENESNPVRFS